MSYVYIMLIVGLILVVGAFSVFAYKIWGCFSKITTRVNALYTLICGQSVSKASIGNMNKDVDNTYPLIKLSIETPNDSYFNTTEVYLNDDMLRNIVWDIVNDIMKDRESTKEESVEFSPNSIDSAVDASLEQLTTDIMDCN